LQLFDIRLTPMHLSYLFLEEFL